MTKAIFMTPYTEDINITLSMQKIYIYLGQENFHYTHPKMKKKQQKNRTNKIVSKVGYFIHFS